MNREHILETLRREPLGVAIAHILSELHVNPYSEDASVVEALLFLSPEARLIEGRWRLAELGRGDRILAAIEAYASSTGKKLFRIAAALQGLPLKDQPTLEELEEILARIGDRYTLLPNATIRRNY